MYYETIIHHIDVRGDGFVPRAVVDIEELQSLYE